MIGYVISVLGICITALIAISQLRQERQQKTLDRELETKRNILLDAVRGMSQAQQAFSSLSDLQVSYTEIVKLFQSGMAQITVASSVASLHAAKAGKEFTDKLGPLFLDAAMKRMQLEMLPQDESRHTLHIELAAFILSNMIELAKSLLRAIAAVRTDIGIAKESEEQFLAVVYPNEKLVKAAIDKALWRD